MSPDWKFPPLTNLWAKESAANSVSRPSCHCLKPQYDKGQWTELKIHAEQQDTTCTAWIQLSELIDEAVKDKREEFSPAREMSPEQWTRLCPANS